MNGFDDDFARQLGAAREGSAEELGRLLEACRGYLLLIAERELDPQLRAKGGASDLVQQTLLDACQDFERFAGTSEADVLAWLRRVLLNNLTDFARLYRGTDKRQVDREQGLGANTLSGSEPARDLAGAAPTPSQLVIARENAQNVRAALQRLPEEYRQVILLRVEENKPFDEVGRLLNRSENAAQKLFTRAIERLQQELGEQR